MDKQYYMIQKENKKGDIVYFDRDMLNESFRVTPKNVIQYDGVMVNQLVVVKLSFVEKILKRKIIKKLELYLDYVVDLLDSDSDDSEGSTYNEVLNDLSRYKDILRYKYQKYLGEKYVDFMIKKIDLLGYELSLKSLSLYDYAYEEVNTNKRSK